MSELFLKDEFYKIIGAAMEVYNELGPGFLESIYHEALQREFTSRGIPFKTQSPVVVAYKGLPLRKAFVVDFICFDCIIVEIKAIGSLTVVDDAQTLNYLRGTGYQLGALINFGDPDSLRFRRIVHEYGRTSRRFSSFSEDSRSNPKFDSRAPSESQ